MRGHGATVVGSSLKESVFRAVYSTKNAELQPVAMQLGEPYFLAKEEAILADELHKKVLDRPWNLWKSKLRKQKIFTGDDDMKTKAALIVGASKGLGLAIVQELLERGWQVTGTVRGTGETQLHRLAERFSEQLKIEHVDITSVDEIASLKSRLLGRSFDLLFVSAGVANAKGMRETIGEVSTEEFVRVMVTNSLSPMRVVEQLADLVSSGGTIGIMSSGQGSIADNESGGNDVYRASKAALNMVMRSFATRRGQDHALLLLAPGWIKTEMGGTDARFTVEETISDIVDTIVAQEGKTGLQYLDRFGKTVRW
jgi:NAD(P)-dependent dehydrogenase (short-subunit alcohol dehydrogenase family)